MKLSITQATMAEIEADVLVVNAFHKADLGGAATWVDKALDGALSAAISDGAFKGVTYEAEWVYPAPGVKARRVLLIGAGKEDQFDVRSLRNLAGAAARQARKKGARSVCLGLTAPAGVAASSAAEIVADGVLCGLAGSDLYKDRTDKNEVAEGTIWVAERDDLARAEEGLRRGEKIAGAVNFARWLGDEPANVMTTERAAEEARKMAEANGIECDILDEEAIKDGGMNSLLSVAAGSANPPRVVVLTYRGASGKSAGRPVLGLVGKGVTFDTGGISIKGAQDMHYMKYDMCGAANVIGTVQALAQLKAPVDVIGVAGLVENMPSDRATRPGDVVRAANGKTIEIINTDAEGRLVLADALDLAIKRGAKRLVDVATLTGAIKVALGDVVTGFMASQQAWADEILRAAAEAGERLWQMPLYPDYKDKLKSNIADLMNTGGRFGGASIAAAFLQQFVGNTPWAHLDIAGTGWTEKEMPWQAKGATGVMVRTLIALAEGDS
ncbi:MAG: leucyl aminopeptidase [Chloroflexia bacterium]